MFWDSRPFWILIEILEYGIRDNNQSRSFCWVPHEKIPHPIRKSPMIVFQTSQKTKKNETIKRKNPYCLLIFPYCPGPSPENPGPGREIPGTLVPEADLCSKNSKN